MSNGLVLNTWFYSVIDQLNNEKIVNEIKSGKSSNSLDVEFNPFEVPGTLQSNLVKSLNIDPYFEQNMKQLSEFESSTLLLLHKIRLDNEIQENYQLIIERVDTMAEIYLNGKLIKKTSNAFLEYRIPISKDLLKKGENLLFIVIFPANSFTPETSDLPETLDRAFIRRPTYNYGWDFAPRAVLCGIGETKLNKIEEVQIKDLFIITENIMENYAELLITWTAESQSNQTPFFSFELKILDNKSDIVFSSEIANNQSNTKENFQIKINLENPLLWWPNGLGKQHLYQLEITEKKSKASYVTKFGIRTINLLLNDNDIKTFIFEINGKKIWTKGANWVPTDSLTNFSDFSRYKELLSLAKNANFNMLRIWGGGVVEKNEFYNLCDELGLMLWHDFQFACTIYPEDNEFLSNVDKEIQFIIKKLRNHPSVVLWCGNNENEWIYTQRFEEHYQNGLGIGKKLHQLKNRLCNELDPSRPYWRSSPWSEVDKDPNSQFEGNNHDWFVWHGVGFETPPQYDQYSNNQSRFITEFGIQSLPVKQTINRMFNPSTQEQPNDTWSFHNIVMDKIIVNLKKFGRPNNIDEWIIFTQAAQAYGIKHAIEAWRSRKYETGGALVWQFNEPWPTICWSLVDYYNNPKMAYWLVKKAFEATIIVYDKLQEKITVINDLYEIINGEVIIRNYSNDGSILSENNKEITVNSNEKKEINFSIKEVNKNSVLWLNFFTENFETENLYLFDDPVNIDFPNSKIAIKIDREKQELTLVSQTIAYIVNLPLEIEPQDNYFYLIPNRSRNVKINKLPIDPYIEISVWKYDKKKIKMENSK